MRVAYSTDLGDGAIIHENGNIFIARIKKKPAKIAEQLHTHRPLNPAGFWW